jgi:hypothetical protein
MLLSHFIIFILVNICKFMIYQFCNFLMFDCLKFMLNCKFNSLGMYYFIDAYRPVVLILSSFSKKKVVGVS